MSAFLDKAKAKKCDASALKDMELHTMKDLGLVYVLRVLTGWIYYTRENGKVTSAVFVPQRKSAE